MVLHHSDSFLGLGLHSSPFKHSTLHLEDEHPSPFDMDFEPPVVVHDAWAAPPLAPGIWDLDLSPQKMEVDEPKFAYALPPLPITGLATPPASPLSIPPAPRPASLTLAPCHAHCSPPANAFPDEEDIRRGRSPGPAGMIPPPAPRLDGKELPGANSGPAPPLCGTRRPMPRQYSALGLDLSTTIVSPPSPSKPLSKSAQSSPSRMRNFPIRTPSERRGKSDDLHDRISNWSTAVAAATSHTTPVHSSSSRDWAEEFAFPRAIAVQRSRSNISSGASDRDHADQLDPWAARIGRARGRTLDMPIAHRAL